MKNFFKLMITAHSGISSKRVCGVFGFGAILFVLIYCTVTGSQAPIMIDTFIYAVCLLLGIDSVTSVFKKNKNEDK